MSKKSQGELFGVALLFVVIVIGILIFSKIKSLDPNYNIDPKKDGKYKILAEGSLNTLLKKSTKCYVERNRDSVIDLVNYCVENSYGYEDDPIVICDDGQKSSCSHVINIMNDTLYEFFNSTFLGPILFKLKITLPADPNAKINVNITNFGDYNYKNKIITESNYRKNKFKKANSGLRSWATAKRNIKLELYLYYQ